MRKINFLIISILFATQANAQTFYPIGDTGVYCLHQNEVRKLAKLSAEGYITVAKTTAVKPLDKKIKKLKAKKSALSRALDDAEGSAKKEKIKNNIKDVNTLIDAANIEKKNINGCLSGTISLPPNFSPLRIAYRAENFSQWQGIGYIDPPPIRIPTKGGYVGYGTFESDFCLSYSGTFADGSVPWPAGTEFNAKKSLNLNDQSIQGDGIARLDKYGGTNGGIIVVSRSGNTIEEAKAKVVALVGSIQYSARVRVANTCEADKSSL